MFEILILSNNQEKNPVTAVFESFGDDCLVQEKCFVEKTSKEDFSQLQCIVLCFHGEQISFDQKTGKQLERFLKKHSINTKIPVIPIIYAAEPERQSILEAGLIVFIKKHQTLNFLEKGLIWFENESPEEFQKKIREAKFSSGYSRMPQPEDDDYEYSGKSAAIFEAIVMFVSILLGCILGPIAGGLIGGLVLGGIIPGLIGAGIGLVAGPILGGLLAKALSGESSPSKVEKRDVTLQQSELNERNNLWDSVREKLFPVNLQSFMAPLLHLKTSVTSLNVAHTEVSSNCHSLSNQSLGEKPGLFSYSLGDNDLTQKSLTSDRSNPQGFPY